VRGEWNCLGGGAGNIQVAVAIYLCKLIKGLVGNVGDI
jgi:hypothetical protein